MRATIPPEEVETADLPGLMDLVRTGELPGLTLDDRADVVDDWLRWAPRENPVTRMQWACLAVQGRDRDGWVLDLWRSMLDEKHPNREVKAVIAKEIPWDFYQRYFFDWFLSRFDVRAARGVFVEPRWATLLHCLLVAILVTVPWLSLGLWTTQLSPSLRVFGTLLLIVAILGAFTRKKLPLYAYFNSLSPRLAAAVGIGYLFFFSAPHLVKILNDTWRPLWLGVVALVAAAFVYLTFHISRRVHPRLKSWDLFRRSGAILALAVAYSSLGILVAGPMLFSNTFLSVAASGQPFAVHADLHRLAFCAAVALNLGVVLQLAWDEKPLTEPL